MLKEFLIKGLQSKVKPKVFVRKFESEFGNVSLEEICKTLLELPFPTWDNFTYYQSIEDVDKYINYDLITDTDAYYSISIRNRRGKFIVSVTYVNNDSFTLVKKIVEDKPYGELLKMCEFSEEKVRERILELLKDKRFDERFAISLYEFCMKEMKGYLEDSFIQEMMYTLKTRLDSDNNEEEILEESVSENNKIESMKEFLSDGITNRKYSTTVVHEFKKNFGEVSPEEMYEVLSGLNLTVNENVSGVDWHAEMFYEYHQDSYISFDIQKLNGTNLGYKIYVKLKKGFNNSNIYLLEAEVLNETYESALRKYGFSEPNIKQVILNKITNRYNTVVDVQREFEEYRKTFPTYVDKEVLTEVIKDIKEKIDNERKDTGEILEESVSETGLSKWAEVLLNGIYNGKSVFKCGEMISASGFSELSIKEFAKVIRELSDKIEGTVIDLSPDYIRFEYNFYKTKRKLILSAHVKGELVKIWAMISNYNEVTHIIDRETYEETLEKIIRYFKVSDNSVRARLKFLVQQLQQSSVEGAIDSFNMIISQFPSYVDNEMIEEMKAVSIRKNEEVLDESVIDDSEFMLVCDKINGSIKSVYDTYVLTNKLKSSVKNMSVEQLLNIIIKNFELTNCFVVTSLHTFEAKYELESITINVKVENQSNIKIDAKYKEYCLLKEEHIEGLTFSKFIKMCHIPEEVAFNVFKQEVRATDFEHMNEGMKKLQEIFGDYISDRQLEFIKDFYGYIIDFHDGEEVLDESVEESLSFEDFCKRFMEMIDPKKAKRPVHVEFSTLLDEGIRFARDYCNGDTDLILKFIVFLKKNCDRTYDSVNDMSGHYQIRIFLEGVHEILISIIMDVKGNFSLIMTGEVVSIVIPENEITLEDLTKYNLLEPEVMLGVLCRMVYTASVVCKDFNSMMKHINKLSLYSVTNALGITDEFTEYINDIIFKNEESEILEESWEEEQAIISEIRYKIHSMSEDSLLQKIIKDFEEGKLKIEMEPRFDTPYAGCWILSCDNSFFPDIDGEIYYAIYIQYKNEMDIESKMRIIIGTAIDKKDLGSNILFTVNRQYVSEYFFDIFDLPEYFQKQWFKSYIDYCKDDMNKLQNLQKYFDNDKIKKWFYEVNNKLEIEDVIE